MSPPAPVRGMVRSGQEAGQVSDKVDTSCPDYVGSRLELLRIVNSDKMAARECQRHLP